MPNPTKEDMVKMHSGQRHDLPAKPAPAGQPYFANGAPGPPLPSQGPPQGAYTQQPPSFNAGSPVYATQYQGPHIPGQTYHAPPGPNASEAEKAEWKPKFQDNIDKMIADVTGQAVPQPPQQVISQQVQTDVPTESKEAAPAKKSKKERKDKVNAITRLLVSDNMMSPEEKRARIGRYAKV